MLSKLVHRTSSVPASKIVGSVLNRSQFSHGSACPCCNKSAKNTLCRAFGSSAKGNKFLNMLEKQKNDPKGTPLMLAEGFVFELERRGFLQMGPWSPASILKPEFQEVYKQMHKETIRAGTDIILACTYYAHKEKLRLIDSEGSLEAINRTAIQLAKQCDAEIGGEERVIAGNICNTNVFEPGSQAIANKCRDIFREQLEIAKSEGVDCIVAETFSWTEEARIAVEECKRVGLPVVVNLAVFAANANGKADAMNDDQTVPEAFRILQDEGADVVGLNCWRGPNTTLPLLKEAVDSGMCSSTRLAAVPMGYRTTEQYKTVWGLPVTSPNHFPELEQYLCDREQWTDFALSCRDLGQVAIVGTCCGGWVHHVRAMNEALGRKVPASEFSPMMSKHTFLGTDQRLSQKNRIATGGVKG